MLELHPLKRRLLAEEFVRLRRADEQRRYSASQRRGRIDPNPHQIDAVVFALRRIPEGGCILADEVGLGKTIEAGLVIAQLLTEGKRRILLIVPKSLLGQWQTELYSLFGIEAREGRHDPEAFAGAGVFLVHREYAGGKKGSSLLKESVERFDLVVIDEAHEVFANIYKRFDIKDGTYKVESSDAETADRVRSFLKLTGTPVLLLTATPIQNSLTELWGLVQYVEETDLLLGKLPTFRAVFCEDNGRSLVPGQEFELRRRLGNVLQRTLRNQAQKFLEVPFVERQAKLIEYSMSMEEKELYNDVTVWLMEPHLCSFSGSNRQLLLIGFHRRMASSLAALKSSLEKVADRLRKQLATRENDSGASLAKEFADDLEEDPEDFDNSETENPTGPPSQDPRAELKRIENFIGRTKAIRSESKANCLLDAIKVISDRGAKGEGTGKVVIFTESLQTQDFLCDLLTEKNYLLPEEITLFRGQNDPDRARVAVQHWEEEIGRSIPLVNQPSREIKLRLALVHEFQHRSKVFISTEAGAKGLNLQFCENLINYDLPWNPQRIEQRIGRIHRYGQRRGVTVFNFLDRGNEAQRLTFDILSQKLDLFGKVLGAADAVLHTPSSDFPDPLVSGVGSDFETQLRRIYAQARSIDEVTTDLRNLRDSMDKKRKEFDDEQKRTADLIQTRLDNRLVQNVFQKYRETLPAGLEELDRDLDSLLGAFLEALGTGFERVESVGRIIYRISSPAPKLPDGYREGGAFLIGHAHDQSEGEPIHPGHPLILAAVDEARQATVRPLTIELVPGIKGLPECLSSLTGRRGRLVITKVAYRGFEWVDHLLKTAMLEHEVTPLDGAIVEALLALSPRDIAPLASPLAVNLEAMDDAIDEAILEDQAKTTVQDENQFERRLEQLDRYLADRILVLNRQRDRKQKNLEEEQTKQKQAPSARIKIGQAIESLEKEISKLTHDIALLQQGEDADYQSWRDRLYSRRYQRPTVERILQVDFRLGGDRDSC